MKKIFKPAIYLLAVLIFIIAFSAVSFADGACADDRHMWNNKISGDGIDYTPYFKTDDNFHTPTCIKCHVTNDAARAEHEYSEWKIVSPSTVSSIGTRERVCSVCKYKQTENFCDHLNISFIRTNKDSELSHSKICNVCNKTLAEKMSCYGGQASCTERAVCLDCGNEYGDYPLGHRWQIENNGGTLSFNEEAHYDACVVCGEAKNTTVEFHIYGPWRVNLTPTEDSDGERTRVCETCGYEQKEVIPRLESEGRSDIAFYIIIALLVLVAVLALAFGMFLIVWLLFYKRTMRDVWECIVAITIDLRDSVVRIFTAIGDFFAILFKKISLLFLKIRNFFCKIGRRIKGFFQAVGMVFVKFFHAIKNIFVR